MITRLLPVFAVTLLVSCGQSEMSMLSDAELLGQVTQCSRIPNPSRRKAIACGNYTRECEKRSKKDNGGWDC